MSHHGVRISSRFAIVSLLSIQALALSSPVCARQSSTLPSVLDARLSGSVSELVGGAPVAGARVTLFLADLSFFREVRSLANGSFAFGPLPQGSFRLGVAATTYDYDERLVTLTAGTNQVAVVLRDETEDGRWDVIGNTEPELFDATDIAILLPDGWILYCHDTVDPVMFDPRTGAKILPPGSWSAQGCMNATLLADGSVLMVGGQDGEDAGDFVNGIPWVKRFLPPDTWTDPPDLVHAPGRWYPGMARLSDGSLLAMGGGQSPDASRTETCERLDLATMTWSYTDSLANPLEFPPSALLYDGRVLQTWGGQPELYDPASESWSSTGNFVFANRGWPGHSDHSILVLSDGRVLAVGVNPTTQPGARMTEIYDPVAGAWSLGTSPSLVRFQTELVYLPDGKVFVGAGDKGFQGGSEPDVLGVVRRCDLLDPVAMTWRRVPNMEQYREYHAVTVLLHDARVATTGGTKIKFQYGPTSADVEAYSPPYLFRGVRPELSALSDASPVRGSVLRFRVYPATKLTHVVLMGLQSTTHWVDCGIPRRLVLPVQQAGTHAWLTLPSDPELLPLGWYFLFGMVDDIPSVAVSLRVDP